MLFEDWLGWFFGLVPALITGFLGFWGMILGL